MFKTRNVVLLEAKLSKEVIGMGLTDALLWCLSTERKMNDRSGIYGFTQRTLAYNSNRIEGSTLSEEQTAALFEEGFLPPTEDIYKAKDIEEMNGHFLMFNHMLENMEEVLSEKLIKELHYELKAGVFEDRTNGYAIGDYKRRPNFVGNMRTTLPEDVGCQMESLLEWYHSVRYKNLGTLAILHVKYESVHPFQDGNGRTGRIIVFRECLKNNITPFIVQNSNRAVYITALRNAQADGDFTGLVNYFKSEQDVYRKQCEFFCVEDRYAECVLKQ